MRRGNQTGDSPVAHFFCKLTPPRPTFPRDITDAEREVMRQHVAYWSDLVAKGTAILFGPVADPQGGYGVAVVDAADELRVRELTARDPAIESGLGFSYTISAMPQVIVRDHADSQ